LGRRDRTLAPSLTALIAHPSALPAEELKSRAPDKLAVTSYGSLLRLPWLASTAWRLVIFDEAQAIKNAGAKQPRAAKRLSARADRFTGTPNENRLGDLWFSFYARRPLCARHSAEA
jgi:non-specific serine/threonine protein kinase